MSVVRVAAATAASTDAPGGAVICARVCGYRAVIALTASNTDTCTTAIALTAGGVPGSLDAISAAFAFASVTMSAPVGVARASSNDTRTAILIVIPPSASAVHVQAECQSSAVDLLRLLVHRVIARSLNVAEQTLESEAPEERGATGHLHRLLDRPDRRS